MPAIALATCERPITRDTDIDFLGPALRRRGADVTTAAWTDERVDWGDFDLVLLRSTWDYHTRLDRFSDWLATVAGATRLRNELETVRWNLDKRYLRELEQAGVPTIPTIWTEPGGEDEIERTVAELGWGDVVVKPVVDLGAERLARVETAMVGRILRSLDEPGMAQPFMPSLQSVGEISVVLVAGRPLHAVRKRPARGDFRVQSQYGGSHESLRAPAEALELASAALAVAPGDPLYGRVDLVADDRDGLRVIELELIEPRLYLDTAPRSAELLALATLAAI
jgi:glutathione synthase/RimK-type ligase-like ATP-grasp enzyme